MIIHEFARPHSAILKGVSLALAVSFLLSPVSSFAATSGETLPSLAKESDLVPLAPLSAQEKRREPASFVEALEQKMGIEPPASASLPQRYEAIQRILYGEVLYPNPQELMPKLAIIFPKDAEKFGVLSPVVPVQKPTNHFPPPSQTSTLPQQPAYAPSMNHTPSYPNHYQPPAEMMEEGPSRMKQIGQALGGTLMVAGALTGAYLLNKKFSGNNNSDMDGWRSFRNRQWSPNRYGYMPYGYGYNPYGYGYAPAPYGYAYPTSGYYPNGSTSLLGSLLGMNNYNNPYIGLPLSGYTIPQGAYPSMYGTTSYGIPFGSLGSIRQGPLGW